MAHLDYIHLTIRYLHVFLWHYKLVVSWLLTTILQPTPLSAFVEEEPIEEEPPYSTDLVSMAEQMDRRPQVSPFASSIVTVVLGDGNSFNVPRFLLNACPKIREAWVVGHQQLDLKLEVGHAIFYYLLTDTYQCLRPKGESHREKLIEEFKTGVQVYIAARKYHLPGLQSLAQKETQALAKELPFPLVLNLFQQSGLKPDAGESWVDEYVQSGLENIFRHPTTSFDDGSLETEKGTPSFTNVVLKNLAALLSKDLVPTREDIAVPPVPSLENALTTEVEPAPTIDTDPAPKTEVEPTPAAELENGLSTKSEAATIESEFAPQEEKPPAEPVQVLEEPSSKEMSIHTLPTIPEPVPEPVPEPLSSPKPEQTNGTNGTNGISTPKEKPLEASPQYVTEPVPEAVPKASTENSSAPDNSDSRPQSPLRRWPTSTTKVEEPLAFVVEQIQTQPLHPQPCSRPGTPKEGAPLTTVSPTPPYRGGGGKKKMKKRSLRLLDGSSPSPPPPPALEVEPAVGVLRS